MFAFPFQKIQDIVRVVSFRKNELIGALEALAAKRGNNHTHQIQKREDRQSMRHTAAFNRLTRDPSYLLFRCWRGRDAARLFVSPSLLGTQVSSYQTEILKTPDTHPRSCSAETRCCRDQKSSLSHGLRCMLCRTTGLPRTGTPLRMLTLRSSAAIL
jgi:hypothetical protein